MSPQSSIVFCAILLLALVAHAADTPAGKVAPKPLFRDPIEDGAADPTPIWNAAEKKWFIFYTNRRAKTPAEQTPDVTWVHGTRIGIAESTDGATWTYRVDRGVHRSVGDRARRHVSHVSHHRARHLPRLATPARHHPSDEQGPPQVEV